MDKTSLIGLGVYGAGTITCWVMGQRHYYGRAADGCLIASLVGVLGMYLLRGTPEMLWPFGLALSASLALLVMATPRGDE